MFPIMAKCLVTGGAGFVGSHLTDRLIELGHEVVVFDNLLTGSKENLNPNAEFVLGDIRDTVEVEKAVQGVEIVFHTAAIARTPWTIEDPVLSHEITATGTLNLLEASRHNDVKRFVHSSSCIVYVPFTPYFVAKQCAEEYVRLYPELYGLSTIALRYSNVYGSRQSEKGPSPNVFAALRKSKKENGRLLITGDGEQTRDYTHVSDIVEANISAALSDIQGVYYVGTGVPTSLNEVAPYFCCPIEYVDERKGDIKHLVMDPTDFKRDFNWTPKVDIHEGIHDVL